MCSLPCICLSISQTRGHSLDHSSRGRASVPALSPSHRGARRCLQSFLSYSKEKKKKKKKTTQKYSHQHTAQIVDFKGTLKKVKGQNESHGPKLPASSQTWHHGMGGKAGENPQTSLHLMNTQKSFGLKTFKIDGFQQILKSCM